jgi:hypothetical protein
MSARRCVLWPKRQKRRRVVPAAVQGMPMRAGANEKPALRDARARPERAQ